MLAWINLAWTFFWPALISAVDAADDFNVDATDPTSISSGDEMSSSLALSCDTSEYLKSRLIHC